MTAFTILGILAYWWLMGCIGFALGYGLRTYVDMRQGIKRLTADIDNSVAEIRMLVSWLTVHGKTA